MSIRKLITLGLVLLAMVQCGDTGSGSPGERMLKEEGPSVVHLRIKETTGGEKIGSGIVFNPTGRILTTQRMIENIASGWVISQEGDPLPIKAIYAQDEYKNLAILEVDVGSATLQAASLGRRELVSPGASVVAIGLDLGVSQMAMEGTVLYTLDNNDYVKIIRTDISYARGFEGGPLLDENGEVVGVIDTESNVAVGIDEADGLRFEEGTPQPVPRGAPIKFVRAGNDFKFVTLTNVLIVVVLAIVVYILSTFILFKSLISNVQTDPATAFGWSALLSWGFPVFLATLLLSGTIDWLFKGASWSDVASWMLLAGGGLLCFVVILSLVVARSKSTNA
ncbi:MAG: hypothetical protein GKR89_32970 [Candidatus Latescibacteria bacterium]|nr:hypothetical protein [Candidatus Latescibacterota bacterium]